MPGYSGAWGPVAGKSSSLLPPKSSFWDLWEELWEVSPAIFSAAFLLQSLAPDMSNSPATPEAWGAFFDQIEIRRVPKIFQKTLDIFFHFALNRVVFPEKSPNPDPIFIADGNFHSFTA